MAVASSVHPFLWFDDQAEQAAALYTSLVPNSRVTATSTYPEGSPGGVAGSVMSVSFELDGLPVEALNAGPEVRFTEAFSFHVSVVTQDEVDALWDGLIAGGGEPSQCGWLKDRFGLSWQIVPKTLDELLGDPDPERAGRAMRAMLGMQKLDVAALRAAADG
ncbi:VOC family protein [Cellulomonas triticagri]|uniref:VOC family protein n=1 Tax=Cellulomonas triticagri TaxID=2483352 RepID=UPI0018F4F42D|nr:VOC family protein [Cellulomonas triticagri]